MALKLSLNTSAVGAGFPEAYARIDYLRGNKTTCELMVVTHASEAARLENARPVMEKVYALPSAEVDGVLYVVLYNWLKTHEDFAGAVDC
jgi:hypothetical protein